jgi:hypothetical protein
MREATQAGVLQHFAEAPTAFANIWIVFLFFVLFSRSATPSAEGHFPQRLKSKSFGSKDSRVFPWI